MSHTNENGAVNSLSLGIADAKDLTAFYTSKIAAAARATRALFESQHGQADKSLEEMADLIACLAEMLNVEVGAMLVEALEALASLGETLPNQAHSKAFTAADRQHASPSVQ